MADTKISNLMAMLATEVATGDFLVIVDVSTGETKKIRIDEFFNSPGDIMIYGLSPSLILNDTDGTAGFNSSRLTHLTDSLLLQAMNGTTLVATVYEISYDATGATSHRWSIGASEMMRLASTGYLGIGTTSPQAPLDVVGDVQLRGTIFRKQDTITTKSTTATLTAAELLTKIINYTGSGHTLTLPTATDTIAGMPSGIANQTSFDFSVINTGSGSATLATNTGVTSVGSLVVAAGASGSFRMRKTTASTCTIYRMS